MQSQTILVVDDEPPILDLIASYLRADGFNVHTAQVANGGYPSFVGQPVDVLKDANGKALGKSLVDAAAPAGGGSVEYPHINPVSHRPESKVAFVEKAGEDVCGVGAYNPKG